MKRLDLSTLMLQCLEDIKGEKFGSSWIEVPKVVVQIICFKFLNQMALRSSIFVNLKCLEYVVQLALCHSKFSLKLRNRPRCSAKRNLGEVSVKNKLQLCISPVLFCSLLVIYTMFQDPKRIRDYLQYLNPFIHSFNRNLLSMRYLFRSSRWPLLNKISMVSTCPPSTLPAGCNFHGLSHSKAIYFSRKGNPLASEK